MKKFILIFGPSAVGKMTVGFELSKLTGLKLFHNHMTIDLVLNFFEWGSEQFKLNTEFRRRIFEEVAASDLEGLIFTFVWALDKPEEKEYVDAICDIFERQGAETYFVELYATQSERLARNETEFRLSQKAPKRNLDHSRQLLLHADESHELNTSGDFFYPERYVRIDNTALSAVETAQKIMDAFGFNGDA